MSQLLAGLMIVVLMGLLIPPPPKSSINYNWSDRFAYLIFLLMMAGSPLIGILSMSLDQGDERINFFGYMWVGVAISLPLSWATARLLGTGDLMTYWRYLAYPRDYPKKAILYGWGFATAFAILVSLVVPA